MSFKLSNKQHLMYFRLFLTFRLFNHLMLMRLATVALRNPKIWKCAQNLTVVDAHIRHTCTMCVHVCDRHSLYSNYCWLLVFHLQEWHRENRIKNIVLQAAGHDKKKKKKIQQRIRIWYMYVSNPYMTWHDMTDMTCMWVFLGLFVCWTWFQGMGLNRRAHNLWKTWFIKRLKTFGLYAGCTCMNEHDTLHAYILFYCFFFLFFRKGVRWHVC